MHNTLSETQLRCDLTAAFRWAARLDMHEAVANHFSAAVSDDGRQFLLNPVGRHFSRMRASELLILSCTSKRCWKSVPESNIQINFCK